jgi:hypothetical protein
MEDPGIVEQHIDPAKPFQGLIHCLAAIFGQPHIGLYKQGFSASGFDRLDNTGAAFPVPARDRNCRTLTGESLRCCAADP